MRYKIGIDEVGRGCLAGPITVTALAIPEDFDFRIFDFDLGIHSPEIDSSLKHVNAKPVLRDSKKLSPKQRHEWSLRIKDAPEIMYVTKNIKPSVIDEINIAQAANLAAHRALKALIANYSLPIANCDIYLDGGLYIKNRRYQEANFQNAQTIVKGDELIQVVSLASIVAKVHRDSKMKKMSKIYPQYGFHIHKGYATKMHRTAIRKHGISEFHRLSFLKKVLN